MEFQNLITKVWTTRGVRFQAHKRLNEIQNWSTWTMNLLTVYITCLSILALNPPSSLTFLADKTGQIFIISISLLLLIMSLLENSKNYKVKADSMHRCGKELSNVYGKLCLVRDGIITENVNAVLIQITTQYQEIIDKYDDNHTDLDYNKFRALNYAEFSLSKFHAFTISLRYLLRVYFLYLVLIIAPILIFIFSI